MALPVYSTILTNIRTAIVEIEKLIEANSDAFPYSFYTQGAFPYWTTALTIVSPQKVAAGIWEMTVRAQVFLHLGWVTEGIDGEAETRAQTAALFAAITFAERPQLQTPTNTRGVTGISPSGLRVQQSGLGTVNTGTEGKTTRAVVIDMQIPITFQLDTKG